MAKSKNHSSHHKNRKDHRNGIKKPSNSHYQISQAKLDPRYLKNLRYVRKKQLADNILRKRCRISYFREEYRREQAKKIEAENKQKLEDAKKKRDEEKKKRKEAKRMAKAKAMDKKPVEKKPVEKKPVKRLQRGKKVKSWNKLYY